MQPEKLKLLLIDKNIISLEEFNNVFLKAKKNNQNVEEILVNEKMVSDEELGRIIAQGLGLEYVNLQKEKIDNSLLNIIPFAVAKNQQAIIFARTGEGLKTAMNNPNDLEFINLLEKKTNSKIIPFYATQRSINSTLNLYDENLQKNYSEYKKNIFQTSDLKKKNDIIIKLADALIEFAYNNNASSIHFVPEKNKTIISFEINNIKNQVEINYTTQE